MDRSPFDIDSLARLANELFRSGDGTGGPGLAATLIQPGPAAVPSQAVNIVPGFEHESSALHGAAPNFPMGTAQLSPTQTPGRPAIGRPAPDTDPASYTKFADPSPTNLDQARYEAQVPAIGFDPHTIPGFAPIPGYADSFHIDRAFDAGFVRQDPLAVPSSVTHPAAATAPGSINPTSPGRPIGAHPGYGPAADLMSPSAQLPVDADPIAQAADIFDRDLPHSLNAPPALSPSGLHPSHPSPVTGHSGGPGLTTPFRAPEPVARTPRAIDLPTPSAFAYQDTPHLGSFDEEALLRSSLASAGRPAISTGLTGTTAPGLPAHHGPDGGETALRHAATAPTYYFADHGLGLDPSSTVPKLTRGAGGFSIDAIRADFPVLHQNINGYPLVWLDNGATTQKPQIVIDRISDFYERDNSNINRSAHELAARATDAYEDARRTVQRFVNAPTMEEIVFVRGTTEGINFVAQSFGRRFIKYGDEIVLTHAEHHANIVPWYLLAQEVGAKLKIVPFDDKGEILLDRYEEMLTDRVKIVAMTHVSNALGTVLPAKAMAEMAHRRNIPVLLDGAQSISHMQIDVQDIDCDFFVFSGHKVFAPTGIGAVYGKRHILDDMPPWQGGGNMIKDVTFEHITFQEPPGRFEAGTGNIADAIGLAEAFRYLERIGMQNIAAHEHAVLAYATEGLSRINGLRIIGEAKEKAGVISFLLDGKEAGAVGKALNQKGIAVRAGHHCALPILRRYGVEATVRPAFAIYNTFEDADRLIAAVAEIAEA